MSNKLIRKCDCCSHEETLTDDGIVHSVSDWGQLSVNHVQFDLCAECTKRVSALLELKMPDPNTAFPGLGGYQMGQVPMGVPMVAPARALRRGHAMAGPLVASGPPWTPPWGTPEIAPGVDVDTGTFTCPKCNETRDCQSFNPVCIACGYQDPDPKYT